MRGWLSSARWLIVAGCVAGVVAVAHGARSDVELIGGNASSWLVLDGVAAAALGAAGSATLLRPGLFRYGVLFAVAGAGIPLFVLPASQAHSGIVFTAQLALAPAVPLAVVTGCAWWPAGPAPKVLSTLAVVALGFAALAQGVVSAVGFDPRANGCFACARNLLVVGNSPRLMTDATNSGLVVGATGAALAAALIVLRTRRSPSSVRRLNAGVAATGFAVSAVTAGYEAYEASLRVQGVTPAATWIWRGFCVTCIGVAVAVGYRLWLVGRSATEAARLMVETGAAPEALMSALQEAAADPSIAVVAIDADGARLDAHGLPPVSEPTRSVLLARGDQPIAEIRFGGPIGALDRLIAVLPALGVGIERTVVRARLRAELRQLTEARLRLVTAMDLERRSLERDLHDGAQQRLLALLMESRHAERQAESDDRTVWAACSRELSEVLAETRDIARGIHPVVLTDAGLSQGLRTLVDGSNVSTSLDINITRTLPEPVEAAVYHLVAELSGVMAERHPSGQLEVRVQSTDFDLEVEATITPCAGVEVVTALDRIDAVRGTSSTVRNESELRVTARLPLHTGLSAPSPGRAAPSGSPGTS